MRPKLGGKDNPLSDEKVRQAMNYAANKEAIMQIVTYDVGSPLTSFMSSATPLHAGDKPLYPYDIEKAKSLMKEAGFENGFETSMLVLAGNQDEIGIATALQQMWAAIGIKLEMQQVDNAEPHPAIPRRHLHDARLGAGPTTSPIRTRSPPTSSIRRPSTRCTAAGRARRPTSCSRLRRRRSIATKRAEQYARIQEIFNASGPTIPLYETPYPVALSKKVHGFLQIPLGNNIFGAAWLEK